MGTGRTCSNFADHAVCDHVVEPGEEERKALFAAHGCRNSDPCIRNCMEKEEGAGRKDDVSAAQMATDLHDQVIVFAVR